jgi:hypothetical protein
MPAHSARRRAGWLAAVGLSASALIGMQAVQNVAQAKGSSVNPATGCGEDSFLDGGASPDPAVTVTVALGSSQTFSVVYHDESPINMNPGFTPQYSVLDSAGHLLQSGAPATGPASAPAGSKDKYATLVSVNWGPSAPGAYVVKIKAWDGDQNKSGGDCGVAAWNVNTPAPPTTAPPTTIPHGTTTTTQPAGTTTTTAPSTPQTNVLGETFTQAPPAAAVNGTPALTG